MKKIHIIFTGGTIAMRTNEFGKLVPAVTGEELTASIPEILKIANITTSQFSNIPSSQMSPELMLKLRLEIIDRMSSENVSGLVVVHGTDTMEETAFFLDAALSDQQLHHNPVVLTGAMRSNDQLSADGMANIFAAILVAAEDESKGRGVMLVMNDEVHSARFVRKMDTSSLQTFASPQFMALGKIVHDHSGNHVAFTQVAKRFTPAIDVPRETTHLPRVDIIMMYAGADEQIITSSVQTGSRAIVVQAVGASSVNLELYEGIKNAIAKNVSVIISSRSPYGICAPVYGYLGGGQTLAELGALFSHDLPAHKARLYAQLCLSTHINIEVAFKALTQ